MAAAFVVSSSRVYEEVSASRPVTTVTSSAALQEEAKMCSQEATWSSELSTAVGEDVEPELSGSESSASSTCPIVGNVLSLSRFAEGSRRVQDALDQAASQSGQELLASEFHGHSVKAMRCPHANHVLQKIISLMPPTSLQFMIDELLAEEGLVKRVATHRYGGRIVQQLLSKCGASQVAGLAEAVLQDAVALSCHTFGSYAVQHLMESGTEQQKYSIVRTVEQNMGIIGRSSSGCGVVVAALNFADADDTVWIARAAIQDPSLVLHLAHGRRGQVAVLRVLSVLRGSEHARARQGLIEGMDDLKTSRYGRKIAAYLEAFASQ